MKSEHDLITDLQTLKTNEKNPPSPESECDEEGFYLIDDSVYNEEIDLDSFPWLDPNHPLYFPPTQTNDRNETTRWSAVDKFSVENWYPYLIKHTFKSYFIQLNYEDIQYLMGTPPTEYVYTKLDAMFNEALTQFSNNEAFLRLSTRSPKDSQYLFKEAASIMSNDLVYWNELDNKNQQLVSFVVSMLKAMKITNGRKIIDTIAQSPRVFGDLIALTSSVDPSECVTNVILREWHDIRPDHEFRVFVSRRLRKESIVTAISQYFHFLYFDKTPADCFNFLDEQTRQVFITQLEHYVLKSVDPEVAQFLNYSSEQDEDDSSDCIREYIVDLALIPENQYHGAITDENKLILGGNTYIMVVIELNPFAPAATGCALFNWKNDLMTLWGKADCDYPVFSCRTSPREEFDTVSLLPAQYKSVIENALSRRLANAPTHGFLINQRDRFFTQEQSYSANQSEQPKESFNLSSSL